MTGTSTADRQELGRTAVRGGTWTVAGQAVRTVMQLAGLVVLARLLSPADFGYVAMVVAVIGVGEVFRDAGLANAAVQARELTQGQRSNLFWLNSALGTLFAVVVVVLAPSIAGLYDEPGLVEVSRWLALTFLFNGVATQFRAGLLRDLRFRTLTMVDTAANLFAVVAAIGAAAAGAGVWALVLQQVARAGFALGGVVVAARWRPGRPERSASIRSLVSYGLDVVGTQLLVYASRNADTVLLGTRLGAAPTGLYNRMMQLVALPIQQLSWPVGNVALPVLSRLRDTPAEYRRFLLNGQVVLLHVVVPVLALAAAMATPLVDVVLGPAWLEGAPIFAVLAVGGVFEAIGFAPSWVFASLAKTRAQLRLTLFSAPFRVLCVLVGSQWGMLGIALAYAVSTAVLWPVSLWWAGRATTAPVRELGANGARALAAHFTAALAAAAVVRLVDVGPWAAVASGFGTAAVVLATLGVLWPALRQDLRQVWKSGSLLIHR